MTGRLRFGTAGLRAALGEGPDEMNVRTVAMAAMAIADWLPEESTVVIGHDARHGSSDFADVSAHVLIAAGHQVERFDRPVPTPVVAWRVGSTTAAAGIVVTASHNPATDNGYKVYGADGAQILPDAAAAIEERMDTVPWPETVPSGPAPSAVAIGDDVIDEYVFAVGRGTAERSLNIVYSAMHGVGGELSVRMLTEAGHTVYPVAEQFDPDPDFPTAPFPNPEERGALDLAIAFAERLGSEYIDLILAHDPDADRLAVAVHDAGEWRRLSGDDVGALLGAFLLDIEGPRGFVATTIVSSSLLDRIAAAWNVPCVRTLTGFKWLVAATPGEDLPLLFAYEEALGYAVSPAVRDKDGLSAALVFAEHAAELRAADTTVLEELARLHAAHGVHRNGQVSVRFEGPDSMERMTAVMAQLRSDPPARIGASEVVDVRDLLDDDELPSSDVLMYTFDGGRVIVRPSGTEPKLKLYLEAVAPDVAIADTRLVELEAAARNLLPD
jgi:phosphomannomutase